MAWNSFDLQFRPHEGLRVIIMTPEYAERWTRWSHNIPDHVGLGWTPYTILIQSYGGCGYKAFHRSRDLRRWLGSHFKVDLAGGFQSLRWGYVRTMT